ncbi:putative amidoligase domain-containing protein [Effusibacillus lacus]|uniref:Phage phiEco32-like COOH-NH2 ligase-type 2 n=1 Tax=Effusibacillus lacus TaxID=1348429 RepID=A0A292YSA0_9BACL|nr:hypothetical protein [Effusibacillus lacus]TCS76241.1 phiEco32-like amidoligase-type 2 protein [Effusibacillus lacus]GAX91791.1 hypothetical protein EFBL_3482 [Effusibacillus lacus]
MGYLLLHTGQPTAKRLLRRIPKLTGIESLESVTNKDLVIRWGNTIGSDSVPEVTLNPRFAILATRSRHEMQSIFRVNGIRCLSSTEGRERSVSLSRHYRVPVFNMRALALYRIDGNPIWLNKRISQVQENFREIRLDEDKIATRVTRLAVRAVHALGLDFGLVSIGMTSQKVLYVLDVSPTPVLKEKLLDHYVNAILDWISEEEYPFTPSFLMGTDLEFVLRNQEGKLVIASSYLPRNGKVGCDALSIRRLGRRFPLAELRPDPSSSPLDLVNNIEETMKVAKRLVPKHLQWLAGSMPLKKFAIGGHIHFSNLPLSSRLIKAMDSYLALPVMLLEDTSASVKRRPKYGFLGDIRLKSHGGWEYRTLSSWIVSPEIARAVLCLAHLVATHYWDLRKTPLSLPELQKAFYNGDKETLRPFFEDLWKDIQSTNTYQRYEEYLDIIPNMIQKGESWDESNDIKRTWGIKYGRSQQRTDKRIRA